jgi:predicted dehydrogenase
LVRVAVVGLGKMGLSHQSIVNTHPQAELVAVCDSTGYLLDMMHKYTGVKAMSDYNAMLNEVPLDAVIIATPSRHHTPMVRAALEKGINVFCEKPFTLDYEESEALAEFASDKGLVGQVGYHYRFVGSFGEMKRLIDLGAIGTVTHVMAEAYGPVVLKAKGSTWRTQRSEGGGCLYDYAAHPINLLNWFFGMPSSAGGTKLGKIYSTDTEDEVYGTFFWENGMTAQLSVNWSDESFRKMSTKITVVGTNGRLYADRQECQCYIRDASAAPEGYEEGWNVRYTTDLTKPVWFYVRGEEYSAQLAHFIERVAGTRFDDANDFASAAQTDRSIGLLIADEAANGAGATSQPVIKAPKRKLSFFRN